MSQDVTRVEGMIKC